MGTLLMWFNIETGETQIEAAKRETLEETDVDCKPVRVLGERIHPNTGHEMAYVLCEYVKGNAIVKDKDELDRVEWMAPPEISKAVTTDIFPPVKEFLQSLI